MNMMNNENQPCESIPIQQNDLDERKANKNSVRANNGLNQDDILEMGINDENTSSNDNIRAETNETKMESDTSEISENFVMNNKKPISVSVLEIQNDPENTMSNDNVSD